MGWCATSNKAPAWLWPSATLCCRRGGAAARRAGPLLTAGPRRLDVVANRTWSKAQRNPVQSHAHLAGGYAKQSYQRAARQPGTALTSSSTPPPAPAAWPAPEARACACCAGALALDMMYGPAAQGFLDGRARRQTRDLGMLVEQAAGPCCGAACAAMRRCCASCSWSAHPPPEPRDRPMKALLRWMDCGSRCFVALELFFVLRASPPWRRSARVHHLPALRGLGC